MECDELVFIPVILSGGAGSRLWPVSREQYPKPFMKLSDGESLLQKAFRRAVELPGVSEVLTVTNREFYFKSEDEYKSVNESSVKTSYILEPFGRNTAPAIASAAVHLVSQYGPNAVMLVLTADHLVVNGQSFNEAVLEAVKQAKEDRLVAFGIQPDSPDTGYGYLEVEGGEVKRFVEKPTLEVAQQYLSSGNYYWNSGMFCFRAGAILEALEVYAPEVISTVRRCSDSSQITASSDHKVTQIELDADCFQHVPDISIDYAVMEKASNLSVVTCDIGWSDIGSWDAFGDLMASDGNGNATIGEVLLHDVTNCYIRSPDRVVGAVGVDNLIIVDTADALLVAARSRTQDVKQITRMLKDTGHDSYKLHKTVHRPWGEYTVLEEGSRFKIKRIVVKPGESLSLQMHHHRSEHWVVVNGMAKVVNGEREIMIGENESTYIPAGHPHKLSNPGAIDVVLIEVQTGQYLGEDDIVRFEDNYGRS